MPSKWGQRADDWGMLVLMVLLASALWIAIKWPEALVLLGEQSFWDGVAKAANLATIAAALLAGIALVFAWPQLRQIRLQQQREAAERARRPRLRIELPENPNQSGDPRVEWLHLQVRNVGEPGLTDLPLTAREVHVSVKVDSDVRERALLWLGGSESGDSVPRRAIWADKPAQVPLVARASRPWTLAAGTRANAGCCYLTDSDFILQGKASVVLDVKSYNIEVTVQYGIAVLWRDKAWFRLDVTPPDQPMQIEQLNGPPDAGLIELPQ